MMKGTLKLCRGLVALSLTLLCLLSVVSVVNAASISTIASNTTYHALRSFGSAIYDSAANRTFVTYSGPEMDVYVRAYNHTSNSWETAAKVYDWNDSSTYAYHDYPTMVLLPDGKLGIFIVDHTTAAYLIKAPNTHSLAGTWTRTKISDDKNAYPMPIVSGNTVYLFYSKNDDVSYPYRTYRYIKSTNSGATWSSPVTVIDSGKTADRFNEVYAFGVVEKGGKIYITWRMSGGGGGHNHASRNLYLAYLNTANGAMYNAGGTSMGNVVNTSDLSSCLVVSAAPDTTSTNPHERHPISNPVPALTSDNKVVVGFGQYVNGNRTIKLASYDSGTWTVQTADSSASSFMDLAKSGTGTNEFEIMYLAQGGNSVISKRTTNLGSSWTTLYNLSVPYASNADTTIYVNYVENRSTIHAIGATINNAERQTDYTGKWNVFAIRQ